MEADDADAAEKKSRWINFLAACRNRLSANSDSIYRRTYKSVASATQAEIDEEKKKFHKMFSLLNNASRNAVWTASAAVCLRIFYAIYQAQWAKFSMQRRPPRRGMRFGRKLLSPNAN